MDLHFWASLFNSYNPLAVFACFLRLCAGSEAAAIQLEKTLRIPGKGRTLLLPVLKTGLWLALLASGALPLPITVWGVGDSDPAWGRAGRAVWVSQCLSRMLWRDRTDAKNRCPLHYFSFYVVFQEHSNVSVIREKNVYNFKVLASPTETWSTEHDGFDLGALN